MRRSDDRTVTETPVVRKGQPYATSHQALDRDTAVQEEVRNAVTSLLNTVRLMREGRYDRPDGELKTPRPK